MKTEIHCQTCGWAIPPQEGRVLCADYAWRCLDCAVQAAPLVHPKHEKDAGVAVRVALALLFVGIILVLAFAFGGGSQ